MSFQSSLIMNLAIDLSFFKVIKPCLIAWEKSLNLTINPLTPEFYLDLMKLADGEVELVTFLTELQGQELSQSIGLNIP